MSFLFTFSAGDFLSPMYLLHKGKRTSVEERHALKLPGKKQGMVEAANKLFTSTIQQMYSFLTLIENNYMGKKN